MLGAKKLARSLSLLLQQQHLSTLIFFVDSFSTGNQFCIELILEIRFRLWNRLFLRIRLKNQNQKRIYQTRHKIQKSLREKEF